MARHHHYLRREATYVGLLGASVVAAWFFLLDLIAGRPLHIASVLGQLLLFGRRTPELGYLDWPAVGAYGVFHVVSFIVVGGVAVGLLHLAIRQPTWLIALVIGFVSLEVAVYSASYAIFMGTGAEYLRWPVLAGNLLAAIVMGAYLWRTHRLLIRWLARVPLGDTGDEAEVTSAAAWAAMGRWRAPWWRRRARAARP